MEQKYLFSFANLSCETIEISGNHFCYNSILENTNDCFLVQADNKVDKKVFSADDLSALLMGLSNLYNIVRGDELIHALAKVKSFIPADRAKDIELKVNQICIDLSPWVSNRNTFFQGVS